MAGALLASVAWSVSAGLSPAQTPGQMFGCQDANCNPVPPVENSAINYQLQSSYYNYSPALKKFIDALEIPPIAVPDKNTFLGADYYELSVVDYTKQMHSQLPAGGTHLRGYRQTNAPASVKQCADATKADITTPACPNYMGPLIVAHQDTPVRIKMTNGLGNDPFFLPVDQTLMGAGNGPPIHADGSYCTVGEAGCTTGTYSQNRALFHLHGGATPWISDGTPHQWTAPVGDPSPYKKGVSAQSVPDMPTGDGQLSYFYPNQQSARMMWYHDHSYGLTRLNVYAGEAADYILTDSVQEDLIAKKVLPTGATPYGTPLVLQDKSFVQAQTGTIDPLWCNAVSSCDNGTPRVGDLWFPHVYIPNQYPLNPVATGNGQNPVGRWDYAPAVIPPGFIFNQLPTLSAVPEAFVDSTVVNGKAYPYYQVGQKAYRFQILNASNDRMFNLQLYYATTGAGTYALAGQPPLAPGFQCNSIARAASDCTEVRMVPANGQGYPVRLSNGTTSTIQSVYVPYDNRPGGVPDPRLQGPPFIQIGNEGGLLPQPVVLNHTPVDFEYDRRQITTLNVRNVPVSNPPQCPSCVFPNPGYTILMGPAERVDVIIDFSQVPDGSTLILYNDAPAPNPGFDNRYDLFTGGPDQTANGGAPTTQAGYAPNTRTLMQFRVTKSLNPTPNGAAAPALNVTNLATALATAYNTSHGIGTMPNGKVSSEPNPPTLTGQMASPGAGFAYRLPSGTFGECINATIGGTSHCGTTGMCDRLTPGCDPKSSVVEFPPCPTSTGVDAQGFPDYSHDPGYRKTCGFPVKLKAIVEDFDPLGRMNALLGVEQSAFNAALGQNTFGYFFADPTTEVFTGNDPYWALQNVNVPETQVWTLVHNGVDVHALHFHLVNVQVINRVDWAGVIKSPDANEVGWKEVLRVNPLENVILLVRPKAPSLPFGIPRSIRPMDVTAALGTTDPANPAALFPFFVQTTTNQLGDFGWEYVWHCHLLGHEENDMMRPLVFQAGKSPSSPFPTTN